MKKSEKLIVINGKTYCVYFGMICEKYIKQNGINYIEVIDEKLLTILEFEFKN